MPHFAAAAAVPTLPHYQQSSATMKSVIFAAAMASAAAFAPSQVVSIKFIFSFVRWRLFSPCRPVVSDVRSHIPFACCHASFPRERRDAPPWKSVRCPSPSPSSPSPKSSTDPCPAIWASIPWASRTFKPTCVTPAGPN